MVKPVLTHTRQQIEFIQRLTDEAKDFISKSKRLIQQNIAAATEVANKSPEQARLYIEKTIVQPLLSFIHQVIETINSSIRATENFIGQKIIPSSKSFYDHGMEAVLALPAQSQIIFQVWVLEAMLQNIQRLSGSGRSLVDDSITGLNNLLRQLKNLIDRGVTGIAEQVKNSPFWDGKRNNEAMA